MSTNPSLVSVIIPAYNVEPWIGKAIDSVLAQTHEQLEILVTDDGSEDDTISVVIHAYDYWPMAQIEE
jgi:glycosyltransferase involved in cell wall biosynthesis